MKPLTERQKAAIYFHLVAGCKDRELLFRIAEGDERANKLTDKSRVIMANRWYNSEPIQTGINEIRYIIEQRRQEDIKKAVASLETEPTKREPKSEDFDKINFLDRDEFLKFLNDRANEITDDKLRNDILKMLSDNLRYKDSDQTDDSTQIKAYLPIICQDCELYKRCKGCDLSQCNKQML